MRLVSLVRFGLLLAPLSALAWDPNEGANDIPPGYQPSFNRPAPIYRPSIPTPATPMAIYYAPAPNTPAAAAPTAFAAGVPARFIAPYPPSPAAPATSYVPTAPGYAAPVPPPPAPVTYVTAAPAVIAYTPPAPPPAPALPPSRATSTMTVVPTPQPMHNTPAPRIVNAPDDSPYRESGLLQPDDRATLGIEGFWDNYHEESVDLDSNAGYGSLTGAYQHYFDPRWFGGMDGRVSYGRNDYQSISGEADDIPQWEFELRGTGGYRFLTDHGGDLELYSGLGSRYFRDDGKGETTNLGAIAYDRRIFQVYWPVGITHRMTSNGWTYTQNLEADALLWGNVSSRLQNTGLAFGNIQNRQNGFSGFGLRGEATFAQLDADGSGFEFGPFFRLWDIDDSQFKDDPVSGQTFLEPANKRYQLGGVLRYKF